MVVGGCELESPLPLDWIYTYTGSTPAALGSLDYVGTGLIIMCLMINWYSMSCMVGLCVAVSVLRVAIKYIIINNYIQTR